MSVFRESLVFFDQVGLFDVVLPFLLVFTLVFGVLEKSRILGTEGKTTRKNLNAMVAFCTAFFVVASAQLVALINVFVARVALVLVILIMLMLLIGSLLPQQGNDGFDFFKNFKWIVYIVIAAVVLIFADGVGWLQPAWAYAVNNWNSELMGTAILFAIVAGFIWFLTSPSGEKKES